LACLAERLRQSFRLFGTKMPFVPERAGEPERIEQKSGHGGNMRRRSAKVQRGQRGSLGTPPDRPTERLEAHQANFLLGTVLCDCPDPFVE
jgi:hypothetical protein